MMLKIGSSILKLLFFYTLFIFVSQITCYPLSNKPQDKAGQGEVADHGGATKKTLEFPRVEKSSKGTNNLPSWIHGLGYPFDEGFQNRPLEKKISHITKMLNNKSGAQQKQHHTFSPVISTRVFNMLQFLDQLKLNLESLTDEEDFPSAEIEIIERVSEQGLLLRGLDAEEGLKQSAALTKKGKISGGKNNQHFVYNNQPYKNGYKFGLG